MNTETNHLVDLKDKSQKEIGRKIKEGHEPVPYNLKGAAKKTLGNKDSVYVSKNSGGKLSNWAKSLRKRKRKIQNQSRKQNR